MAARDGVVEEQAIVRAATVHLGAAIRDVGGAIARQAVEANLDIGV